MKTVLLVGPNDWDLEEASSPRYAGRYRFVTLDHPELHVPERFGVWQAFRRFDVLGFIDAAVQRLSRAGGIDAVVGTDDYRACAVAAVLANRLGLPGPDPAAVLLCQHKYLCRRAIAGIAPEANCRFALIDSPYASAESLGLEFPLVVKPVRAATSVLAARVASQEELRKYLDFPWAFHAVVKNNVLRPYNQMLKRYTDLPLDSYCMIAEEVLGGQLVTVEGCSRGGSVEMVGVTDSVMYPGTMSFARFDYPSRLPSCVQKRMGELAGRLVRGLGLDDSLFNIEMFYDPAEDSVKVLEINPRMSYQFADLYEKVDGTNSYDLQLALAVGERPRVGRGRGSCRAASSFVLRRFADARLKRLPDPERVRRLAEEFPQIRVRLYGRRGRWLSEGQKWVESFRYAIVNLGGADLPDLIGQFERAKRGLNFVFE